MPRSISSTYDNSSRPASIPASPRYSSAVGEKAWSPEDFVGLHGQLYEDEILSNGEHREWHAAEGAVQDGPLQRDASNGIVSATHKPAAITSLLMLKDSGAATSSWRTDCSQTFNGGVELEELGQTATEQKQDRDTSSRL